MLAAFRHMCGIVGDSLLTAVVPVRRPIRLPTRGGFFAVRRPIGLCIGPAFFGMRDIISGTAQTPLLLVLLSIPPLRAPFFRTDLFPMSMIVGTGIGAGFFWVFIGHQAPPGGVQEAPIWYARSNHGTVPHSYGGLARAPRGVSAPAGFVLVCIV